MVAIILLMSSACLKSLLMALAMCLIPALLGWLAAQSWFNVPGLRDRLQNLETANAELGTKNSSLTADNTDLRVKLTQADADIDHKNDQIRKLKNDLIIVESERNILKIQQEEAAAGKKETVKAAAAAATTFLFAGKKIKADDLKIVEGIGPKIEELLHNVGIKTWKALSEADVAQLKDILDAAGPAYQIHDPGTWPNQAGMADRGEWEALEKYQAELDGGKA